MDRELLEELLGLGWSLERIGRRVGKDGDTVAYWVRKYGLEATDKDRHAGRGGLDRAELEHAVEAGLSIAQLAETFDRSKATIRYWLKRHGLRTKNRVGRARHDPLPDAQLGRSRIDGTCDVHGPVEFVRRSGGGYRCSRCRIEVVSQRRRVMKATLVAEAGGCCAICGYSRSIAALEFHHLDPSQKTMTISRRSLALDTLRKEAAKCVLLCSNCHAEVEAGVVRVPVQ